MADRDVSFDGEGQRAVDGAHQADVGRGQEVGQHVDAEDLVVDGAELGEGEEQDGGCDIHLK